jgi:hypothetical protein
MNKPLLILLAGLCVFASRAAADLSGTAAVQADAAIYGADGNATPVQLGNWGAIAPSGYSLGSDPWYVTFSSVAASNDQNSIAGITLDGGDDESSGYYNDPDGIGSGGPSSILAFGSLSGIVLPNWGALVGVFVDTTGFSSAIVPVPANLNFTDDTSFTTLSPLLDQVFFIGDGLTGDGAGSIQDFYVPTGATELFLGIADAPAYGQPPGAYGDNYGVILASYAVAASVTPELVPDLSSNLGLSALAAASLIFFARRRPPKAQSLRADRA